MANPWRFSTGITAPNVMDGSFFAKPGTNRHVFIDGAPPEMAMQTMGRYWTLMNSHVANPYQNATTQGLFFGNKIGNATAVNEDRQNSGVQKTGFVRIASAAGNTTPTAVGANAIQAPNSFQVISGSKIRCFARFRLSDVDQLGWSWGLTHDPSLEVSGTPATGSPFGLLATTDATAYGGPIGTGSSLTDGIIFHRRHADTLTNIDLSVIDGASNTASTVRITMPSALVDDQWIELGLFIDGLNAIHYYVAPNADNVNSPTDAAFGKVGVASFAFLTASLLGLGPSYAQRNAEAAINWAEFQYWYAFQPFQ